MKQYIIVQTLADGTQTTLPFSQLAIVAQSGTHYVVLDAETGKPPLDLKLERDGDNLEVRVDDEIVLQIENYYDDALAVQFDTGGIEGAAPVSNDVLINGSEAGSADIVGAASGGENGTFWTPANIGWVAGGVVVAGAAASSGGGGGGGGGKDTKAPVAPEISLATDPEADGITNDATVNVALESKKVTWNYSTDGGVTWLPDDAWLDGSITSFELNPDTTYAIGAIQVIQKDKAGNVSEVFSNESVITTDMTVGVPDAALATDSGAVDDDAITNDATMNVTLASDVASWEYSLDGGTTWNPGTGTSFEMADDTTYAVGDLQLRQTDIAGNQSAVTSNDIVITTDMTGPSGHTIALEADTGVSDTDNITSDATMNVTGLETNASWEYSLDAGASWSDGTGTSFELAADTAYAVGDIQVRQTDVAGNTGAEVSNAAAITTTAASAITITNIDISVDTGTLDTDFITNTAAQTVTGTLSAALEVGDALMGSSDGGDTWTDITSKVTGTNISWDGVTLAGSSEIQIKVTNISGDGAVATQAYVLDETAPTTTVSAIDISDDTGTLDTDFETNTAAQTITATLSAVLETGEILYGSVDNGTTWTDITSMVTDTAVSWTGATLAGDSSIVLKVTDEAGNDGAEATQAYSLDTTAPTTTVTIDSISADTGAADFITQTAAQTINATLDAALATGEILYGSVDNGATWTDITSMVGTTDVTWTGVTLAGDSSIVMKVTDAAGNDGTPATQDYVVDATAPTTTFTGVSYNADTDTLVLTGTNVNSLLTGDETAADDISGNLDWTKLLLDLNNDDATSGKLTFGLTGADVDVASAHATNDTTLTISLVKASADGGTFEGDADFGITGGVDNIEVAAGFAVDTAGNVASTDAADVSVVDATVVIFDTILDKSSSHSGRTFESGVDYDIYIMTESTGSTVNLAALNQWASANNLGTGDTINFIGSGSAIIGLSSGPLTTINPNPSSWLGSTSSGSSAFQLMNSGLFVRYYTNGTGSGDLWNGTVATPSSVSVAFATTLATPAIYTSQGL